jgi:hypothetical protein
MGAVLHARARVPFRPSFRPAFNGLLQRECACGGTVGTSGECERCSKKKRLALQTKLKVNEPGDSYEQEADRIADQVMGMPRQGGVSGAPLRIQRLAVRSPGRMEAAPASVEQALADTGRPLELTLKQDMEQRFGHDFSRVRVHSGAAAEQSARDVNAQAYSRGQDIVFGAGRFIPGTHEGRRLIAHELTHVVQQSNDVASATGGGIARFAEEEPVETMVEPEAETVTAEEQKEFDREREAGAIPKDSLGPTPYHDRGARTNWQGAFEFRQKQAEAQMRQGMLERPMAVLFSGGDPPDFVTEGAPASTLGTEGETRYTPHFFHILDAIEYYVALAGTDQQLMLVFESAFADLRRKPDQISVKPLAIGWAPMNYVDLPSDLDPGGTKRVEAFKRGLVKRNRRFGRKPKPTTDTSPKPRIAPDANLTADTPERRKGRDPCEPHLDLPEGKRPHYQRYESEVMGYRLAAYPTAIINRLRTTAYERQSNQVRNWFHALDPKSGGRMDAKLIERGTQMLSEDKKCGKNTECIEKQRKRVMKPDWAPDGTKKQMDVDHIIELQLGFLADELGVTLDAFDNYELLDSSTNSSVGSTLDKSLQKERARLKRECPEKVPNWDEVPLNFRLPIFPGGGKGPGQRWTSAQIMAGEHLDAYKRKSK